MSRDEARRLLHGTFSFQLDGGRVVVNDESLIREIHDLMANSSEYPQTGDWAATDATARHIGYGALA